MPNRCALVFLQNQWVRNPERTRQTYERVPAGTHPLDYRERLNRFCLFRGCLTGRRIKQSFDDLIDRMWIEEASAHIGGRSSSVAPADPNHMQLIVNHVHPKIVLCFGEVARKGLLKVECRCPIIHGPHPAARASSGISVSQELSRMAQETRAALAARCSAYRTE